MLPTNIALHAGPSGIVVYQNGQLTLHRNGVVRPLTSNPTIYGGYFPSGVLAASGDWIAAEGGSAGGLIGGRVPGALAAVPPGGHAGAKGCDGWIANPSASATAPNGPPVPFAVASGQLVVPAIPACVGKTPAGARPLFVRRLSGGAWSVLAWFAPAASDVVTDSATSLRVAGNGRLVALGVRRSSTAMGVVVLDVVTGKVRYETTVPPGRLTLGDDGTLIDAAPLVPPSVLADPDQPLVVTPRARRPRQPVASAVGDVALSGGRFAYTVASADQLDVSLLVGSIAPGAAPARQLVGFPVFTRTLYAFDLRGTTLAWVQNQPPTPRISSCFYPVGINPQLRVTDVNAAPVADPPLPPPPPASGCGPPPP